MIFNPYRVDKLFSENLQNRDYVQTSQLIMYKNKQNLIIWFGCVLWYINP